MTITLKQILTLVGKLDDSLEGETARDRFRQFLKENVIEVGQIRDYVEECLRTSGDQYNRALQDLINYIGDFLGFEVDFGRYQGVHGKIGFDGHWKSPTGFHIVIEVKTTGAFAIDTTTLLGYIDKLVREQKIPRREDALGLYVVGRSDPKINQLRHSIIGEHRTNQLRIISSDSLLSLAEIMSDYDIKHEDILAIMKPLDPTIDSVIGPIAKIVAQLQKEDSQEKEMPLEPMKDVVNYWLTPVKSDDEETAEEVIQNLLGNAPPIYAFGERTPRRKDLKPGDNICFYATGKGVVAHAKVKSKPEKKTDPRVRHPEAYPWLFQLEDVKLYIDKPIIIDAMLRTKSDAFKGKDPNKSWAWFVQATRNITEHDFNILVKL